MSSNADLKAKIRSSKAWKDLREKIKDLQEGKDYLSQKKLAKRTAALHHMDLNSEHYGDFSDLSHFVFLNSKGHESLHWAYEIYKKDPSFLDRFKELLDRMVEINQGASFK